MKCECGEEIESIAHLKGHRQYCMRPLVPTKSEVQQLRDDLQRMTALAEKRQDEVEMVRSLLRRSEQEEAKLNLQIDVLTRNLKFIAEHPSTTDPKDDFEKCRAVACLTLDKGRVISERGVTEKRICKACGESPCMCAANAHHAMTGD